MKYDIYTELVSNGVPKEVAEYFRLLGKDLPLRPGNIKKNEEDNVSYDDGKISLFGEFVQEAGNYATSMWGENEKYNDYLVHFNIFSNGLFVINIIYKADGIDNDANGKMYIITNNYGDPLDTNTIHYLFYDKDSLDYLAERNLFSEKN